MKMAIPLAPVADQWLAKLTSRANTAALSQVDAGTLLGERAMLSGLSIPGRISAGGGCRIYQAIGDSIALNLSRHADRELLPALFAASAFDLDNDATIGALIAQSEASRLVERGRAMGLAMSAMRESRRASEFPCEQFMSGRRRTAAIGRAPRVVDLSALWAGPLAAHLLWLGGAEVIKVESRSRPDGMREGSGDFFSLINQGKANVALDFADADDRQALRSIILASDVVIEAARPRALAQLGIEAGELVRSTPGLVWITITGHGARGEAGEWVGFGDDCGVAGGLSQALFDATGCIGFLGDAIADPLTGIAAALAAWQVWEEGGGGRFSVAMSEVAAYCLAAARSQDPIDLDLTLKAWANAEGRPFPMVVRRPIGAVARLGEHTYSHVRAW